MFAAPDEGKIIGQLQNHPAVYLIVANIIIFFALVMLDVIPLPAFGADIQAKIRPKTFGRFSVRDGNGAGRGALHGAGLRDAAFMSRQNKIFCTGSACFCFPYGVGASLILVGTFSGLLARLPRSRVLAFADQAVLCYCAVGDRRVFLVKAGTLIF